MSNEARATARVSRLSPKSAQSHLLGAIDDCQGKGVALSAGTRPYWGQPVRTTSRSSRRYFFSLIERQFQLLGSCSGGKSTGQSRTILHAHGIPMPISTLRVWFYMSVSDHAFSTRSKLPLSPVVPGMLVDPPRNMTVEEPCMTTADFFGTRYRHESKVYWPITGA